MIIEVDSDTKEKVLPTDRKAILRVADRICDLLEEEFPTEKSVNVHEALAIVLKSLRQQLEEIAEEEHGVKIKLKGGEYGGE